MSKLTLNAVVLGTPENRALADYLRKVEEYLLTNPYYPHASPEGTDIHHVREAQKKYNEMTGVS